MHWTNTSSNIFAVLLGIVILVGTMLAAAPDARAASIEYLGENPHSGLSLAVVVEGYALAHTAQLLPLDSSGQLVGEGSVEAQLAQSLFNLETALAAAASGTEHLVKINLYVDGPKTAASAKAMLAKRFPAPVRPALSCVATPLAHPKAILALDAVAVVPGEGPKAVVRHSAKALARFGEAACVAVLPRGDAVYVSGQPEKGDLAAATAKSLQGLLGTIRHLGLDSSHVVHLRAFVRSIQDTDVLRQQVAKAFAGQPLPPLTLVEWTSPAPIEIELIAFAPPQRTPPASRDTVSYFTPPGVEPSPLFSRAARVHGGKTIYISGLYAEEPGSGEAQVRGLFRSLQGALTLTGGDMPHLVKATYYCTDDDSSQVLNKLRPEFYDPQRPPAASKAMVKALALPDRSITLDMIAGTAR